MRAVLSNGAEHVEGEMPVERTVKKASRILVPVPSEIEQELGRAGYWCFYEGPLILGGHLEEHLLVDRTNKCSLEYVIISSTVEDGRTHVLKVEYFVPSDEEVDEEAEDKKDDEDVKGDVETAVRSFGEGEAVYVAFEQVLTINRALVRLWASESIESAPEDVSP
jgi:hypothetical protein